jgi:putative membrane protein
MASAEQIAATVQAGQGGLVVAAHPLVHLNAALNALAAILLALGLWQIKRRREQAHGRAMLAALGVSVAFLTSYLIYHFGVQLTVRFTHEGPIRYLYYVILLSHVRLAIAVPFLAIRAAWLGSRALGWGAAAELPPHEKDRCRTKHVRLVRWAYPIWMYVSVTGVIVYGMLYHLWPSADL